jgi:hypothetical protein
MAIYKFSNVGGFGTYQRYNDFLAGNPTTPVYVDNGAYFPLGEFTLASAQSEVNFINIPQTYTHLQIRCMVIGSTAGQDILMQVNGVTTSNNYARHELRGNGSTASSNGTANTSFMDISTNAIDTAFPSPIITDILDYQNTNKNKTIRTLSGADRNGSGSVSLLSGVRLATTAITSIRIFVGSGNFNANSSFALYGVLA